VACELSSGARRVILGRDVDVGQVGVAIDFDAIVGRCFGPSDGSSARPHRTCVTARSRSISRALLSLDDREEQEDMRSDRLRHAGSTWAWSCSMVSWCERALSAPGKVVFPPRRRQLPRRERNCNRYELSIKASAW
jgi:hypothetical protein